MQAKVAASQVSAKVLAEDLLALWHHLMRGSSRDLYALLMRCGGVRLAGAGVLLHLVHHLTAVASVPVAVAAHLLEAVRSNR